MEIGIIGAGHIGANLAVLLARAGHDVVLSSRHPESIAQFAGGPGGRIRVTDVATAAVLPVVVEAIPFGGYRDLPADLLTGVVVSASNYYPDRDGDIDLGQRADTELVAEHLGAARVVKAFNTIYYVHLQTQGDVGRPQDDRRAIPIAGDDPDAKRVVAGLIEDLGFGAVDNGSLHYGGLRQSTTSEIYNSDVTVAEARRILGV